MGDHHAAILSARMGMDNTVRSDCAPLGNMVAALLQGGVEVHTLRDITRGGLGTTLNEIARQSGVGMMLQEKALPVTPAVAFLFPLSLFPAEQPANTLPTSAPATARLSRTFAVSWVLFCFVMIHSPFSHLV